MAWWQSCDVQRRSLRRLHPFPTICGKRFVIGSKEKRFRVWKAYVPIRVYWAWRPIRRTILLSFHSLSVLLWYSGHLGSSATSFLLMVMGEQSSLILLPTISWTDWSIECHASAPRLHWLRKVCNALHVINWAARSWSIFVCSMFTLKQNEDHSSVLWQHLG